MNPEVCVLWVASDVLMCTASIWHMCTMSMDRYFTLKYPMRYGRNKTRRMVAGKILFVWVVSVAISSPFCIYGFIDTSSMYRNGDCVPKVKNIVIYGSVFAFYVPLLIMIVTYVLTIRILWKNQERMKHIDRSDMKPRLAQLTAQCTGFAIPKLLSSLRKPRQSSLHVSLSRPKMMERSVTSGTILCLDHKSIINVGSVLSDADYSEDCAGGNHVGMKFLAPPTSQTCTPRSSTPGSSRLPVYSDTEESESEPNYFSLLQTSHSSGSLCTPISLTTSEKSLHKRLQKKQLFQQQQRELYLLRQEYHQQRQLHRSREDDASLSSSPVDEALPSCPSQNQNCSVSVATSSVSILSASLDTDSNYQDQHFLPENSLTSLLVSNSPSFPKLSRKPSKMDAKSGKRPSKKKRYSKRCKKRRNSLIQQSPRKDHLEVPYPVYFRRRRTSKQANGHSSLTNAVSDTQVSKAGRDSKTDDDSEYGVSSFHLSHSNLCKDYKSVEWDRRYFQIQEEMDRCLKGEFGPWDRRQSKQEPTTEDHSDINETDFKHKTLLRPEVSLPIALDDPLNACSDSCVSNGYSRSAPSSPITRRNADPLKLNSSSEDDGEDDAENEEASERTNDDEGNDTSGSSNSDIITIRLHPPTPKVKALDNKAQESSVICSASSPPVCPTTQTAAASLTVPLACSLGQESDRTEQMNGLPHFPSTSDSSKNSNDTGHILANGTSTHSLSPGSSSQLPELVISSEGELTLEETDDTVEDSPKHQRVKLRRPQQLHSHYRFQRMNSPRELQADKYIKSKRQSFRSTFRIHRGKGAVKHILSKKTATNEKKASKVLGIIFLVFVILWTPFFAVNILNAACEECVTSLTEEMTSLFLWMGYIASLANPIIYTMFNTAFRRTFIRILTCKIQRMRRNKTSDAHYVSYTTMLASERRNTMTVVLKDESR